MKVEELALAASKALEDGARMTLVLPRPWRNRPPKFPRGELLCEYTQGSCVYSFDPLRVLAWLAANKLITVEFQNLTRTRARPTPAH